MCVKLPLVSVIISNYNYEEYISDSIASCFAQNYPSIEVIVVDDVSTDDSIASAKLALGHRSNGRLIKRLVNGGQGAALLDGFRASSGEFVAFLDADDLLFPDFIGTHIYAHLALPWQVAFTSSHLVYIGRTGQLITGSSGAIRKTFFSNWIEDDVKLPLLSIAPEIDKVLNKFAENVSRCVYLPAERAGYHWSSCSGLLFKRAAIEHIAFDEVLRNVRVSADFYFTLTHFLNGSAVINSRLGAYRVHGKNAFSREISLDQMDDCRGVPGDLFTGILRLFARCVTGSQLDHCHRLLGTVRYPKFLRALESYASLMNRNPGSKPPIFATAIMDGFKHFRSVLGHKQTIYILRDVLQTKNEELRRKNII